MRAKQRIINNGVAWLVQVLFCIIWDAYWYISRILNLSFFLSLSLSVCKTVDCNLVRARFSFACLTTHELLSFIIILLIIMTGEKSSTRFALRNRHFFICMLHFVHACLCCYCWLSAILCTGSGHPHLFSVRFSWDAMGSVSKTFSLWFVDSVLSLTLKTFPHCYL